MSVDAAGSLLHLHSSKSAAPAMSTMIVAVADGKEKKIPVVIRRSIIDELTELLDGIGELKVVEVGDRIAVKGSLDRPDEHRRFQKILSLYPGVLDLSQENVADPNEMIEIDVVIVVSRERLDDSTGFNFLQLMQFHFDIFESTARSSLTRAIPFQSPAGALIQPALTAALAPFSRGTHPFTWGQTLTGAVDYNVNIANSFHEDSKVIARPHLVTRNGQPASFQDGGEVAFRVSGLNSGDIKLYSFGIQMNVTPTLLSNGVVMMDVEAIRSTPPFPRRGTTSDDVQFDKTAVSSNAAVPLGETLILSGLYLRQRRSSQEGVPILRDVPGLNILFDNKVTSDEVLSTLVFLTPRSPAFTDQRNLDVMNQYRQRRLEFRAAREAGAAAAIEEMKRKYEFWYKPQPNRYISHTFLTDNSSIYRKLIGEDLRIEGLEKDIVERPGQ
jgi:Flp pilus assembly secretin CpaC